MNPSVSDSIKSQLLERSRLLAEYAGLLPQKLGIIADVCIRSIGNGGKILLCGNGGSAADSQHLAAELVGRFERERKALPAIALTTDTSILTAVGNDYGFDRIFERQVEAIGNAGDVFVGMSTSGGSINVLRAMEAAKAMGLVCVAFCGEKPGPLVQLADYTIQIPASRTVLIQEGHLAAGHILCDLVEAAFTDLA